MTFEESIQRLRAENPTVAHLFASFDQAFGAYDNALKACKPSPLDTAGSPAAARLPSRDAVSSDPFTSSPDNANTPRGEASSTETTR